MKRVLTALLTGYRLVISPLYGQTCRYYPSCSAYALTAVEVHGAGKGSWLAARRIGRCHPWCEGGVDFVPRSEGYRWWGRAEGTDGENPHSGDRAPVAQSVAGAMTQPTSASRPDVVGSSPAPRGV